MITSVTVNYLTPLLDSKHMHISGPPTIQPNKIVFSYNDKVNHVNADELLKQATLYFNGTAGRFG